jgi:hypothetical protein
MTFDANTFAEIDRGEELIIVVHRVGHETKRVPVWVVTVDGDVYVRSYKGVTSMWFRRVQADAHQALGLGSGDTAVEFENVSRHEHVNEAISAAFASKYAKYDYVDAMAAPAAVDATLRIHPDPAPAD